MIVDLPQPDGPTKAVLVPPFTEKEILFNTILFLVGYLKTTSLN